MAMTRAKNWRWEELEKDSIDLTALAKHFELYNKTEGKSPSIIAWYNLAVRQFHRFLVESNRQCPETGGNLNRHILAYVEAAK